MSTSSPMSAAAAARPPKPTDSPASSAALEAAMTASLEAGDVHAFMHTYSLYRAKNLASDAANHYKALALLAQLGEENEGSFRALIQSVQSTDLEDPMIQLVLEVERLVASCNVEGLREQVGKTPAEAQGLVERIIGRFQRTPQMGEGVVGETARLNACAREEALETIRDCIFVSKNMANFR